MPGITRDTEHGWKASDPSMFSRRVKPRRVFISWSGDVSSAVATALRRLIGDVLGNEDTSWISTVNILAGERWAMVLGQALEQSSIAVVCLTMQNRAAQWLLFEAGAVSHSPRHLVVPLLVGVSPAQIPEPLKQFEAVTADNKAEILHLIRSINELSPSPVTSGRLEARLDESWSKYSESVKEIPDPQRALGGLVDDRRSCYIVCPSHSVPLGVRDEGVAASRALDFLDMQAVVQVTTLLDRCGRMTHPQIVESRTEVPDEEGRDFILLGGSLANNMTKDALMLSGSPYCFSDDCRSLIVPGREPLKREEGMDYGIVVKFSPDEHTYIVLAGIGGRGTLAAAQHLNRLVEDKIFLNAFVACLVSTDLRTNFGLVRQLEACVRVGPSGRDWDVVSSADDWTP